MRKLAYLILLLAFVTFPARAQHSAILKWNASSDAAANPSLSYNVYRFQGPCPTGSTPTFTKVNTAPVTALTYTDTSLALGNVCYYVTATLNGAESAPSASAGGTVPPAGVLTITVTVQ
jgi:hypothetical protein